MQRRTLIDAMFDSLPAVLPHAKGGKARVLAVSTAEFGQFIDSELTKWGQVIKTGGIKAE